MSMCARIRGQKLRTVNKHVRKREWRMRKRWNMFANASRQLHLSMSSLSYGPNMRATGGSLLDGQVRIWINLSRATQQLHL